LEPIRNVPPGSRTIPGGGDSGVDWALVLENILDVRIISVINRFMVCDL